MLHRTYHLILASVVGVLLTSCQSYNDSAVTGKAAVQFAFGAAGQGASALAHFKSLDDATAVVVTIEDNTGAPVHTSTQIQLFQFGDTFVSEPLSLLPGSYRLTEFLVIDAINNVLFATPVEGSPLAEFVTDPLPIEFDIATDVVTTVRPEVLNTDNQNPEDFGYVSFELNLVDPLRFLLAVFIFNPTTNELDLTSATLSIADGNGEFFTADVEPITNELAVPNGRSEYQLTISKPNFFDFVDTFTAAELASFFDSGDSGPLTVVLQPVEPPDAVQVTVGTQHTCVALDTANARCWGESGSGRLGYNGIFGDIGDNEIPALTGDIDVGGLVVAVGAGDGHSCALLANGGVRCWGQGLFGRLGYGNTDDIGDNEPPAAAGSVNVGGTVTQIAVGAFHTCALLTTGNVRCWGANNLGQLGYGNTDLIGDDEVPATAGNVNVGGTVVQITAGSQHTCALLNTGAVRCWGGGNNGRLGYGNTNSIGDNETPATAGDVQVGGTVVQVDAGDAHTCALLDTGAVRCWGNGLSGRLGYANTNSIGDDEAPAAAGDVLVGASATQVSAGGLHTCALLDNGNVRCWGSGAAGRLGYANTSNIGDNEVPASAGDVDVGGSVVQIDCGFLHTCAVLDDGNLRCWGDGKNGKLGYGNIDNIGDNEVPAAAGNVPAL